MNDHERESQTVGDLEEATTAKEAVVVFLKGLAMGLGNIVPGVSGGSIALITGVYPKLIDRISSIRLSLRSIDFSFLMPLGLGNAAAMFMLANVIAYVLDIIPGPTYAFFFGLILASAVLIYKSEETLPIKNLVFAVVGFVIAFLISGETATVAVHTPLLTFISGVLSIITLILPGISGGFILLLIGQYEFIITIIKDIVLFDLAVFGLGGLVGIVSFSRLLKRLLASYREPTLAFLIGLMIGALRLPLTMMIQSGTEILLLILPSLAGFVIVYEAERRSSKKKSSYEREKSETPSETNASAS
ncbi:DUF368 domain-containing protein [Candidatus Thorarchaeota archaeon]|nr:MAG: DUF368 domain-containing protein [Candidatus Thorarchaeota archaeon]